MLFTLLGLWYSRNEQILHEKDGAPEYYHPESPKSLLRPIWNTSFSWWFLKTSARNTTWKTNMSSENQWLEDVFPIEIVPF